MQTDRSPYTCRLTRQLTRSGPIGCPRLRVLFSRYSFAPIGPKRQCWTASGLRLPRSVRKAAPWVVSSRFTNGCPLLAQSGHEDKCSSIGLHIYRVTGVALVAQLFDQKSEIGGVFGAAGVPGEF